MSKTKKVSVSDASRTTPPPKKTRRRAVPWHHLIALGLIAGVTVLAYSNTFHAPFHFDDQPNILLNPNVQVKSWSWDSFVRLISNSYKESIRVFSFLTLALNYSLGGLNVFGYHVVNLLIHIVSGMLLYGFLMMTFQLPSLRERYGPVAYRVALFASLIFVCHPVQTQSVTYIVQRMASLGGMFYLLTMVLYIKGRLARGRIRYLSFGAMVVSYLLGVFSKENVAIVPLLIALYELYFFRQFELGPKGRRFLLVTGGLLCFLGALGFLVWGRRYIELSISGYEMRPFTLGERLLTQSRVVLYYLTLMAFPLPSRLNLDYDFPLSRSLIDPPTTLLSILIIAGLLIYSVWIAKKRPVLSYFVLWYFGNLVIESSVFPLELVYEHRLYLPAVGPFVLFSLLIVDLIERLRERSSVRETGSSPETAREGKDGKEGHVGATGMITRPRAHLLEIIVFSIVILLLAGGSYGRNRLWNDDIELLLDNVEKSPRKARVHGNLAFAYFTAGIYDKALRAAQKAIELDATYAHAYHTQSLVYERWGEKEKAIALAKKSFELDPEFHIAHYTLGRIYFEDHQFEKAAEAFEHVVRVYPNLPEVHHFLGLIYANQRRFDRAVSEFEWDIRISPDHALAHLNVGQIYWHEFKNREKAIGHLKAALAVDPFLPNREEIQSLVRRLEGASP